MYIRTQLAQLELNSVHSFLVGWFVFELQEMLSLDKKKRLGENLMSQRQPPQEKALLS